MDPPHSVRPFLRVRATPLSGISFWAMQSLILLLLLAVPLNAHNGAVAIAVPVEGIVVDGDLSDWPEEVPWLPVELFFLEGHPLSTTGSEEPT